MDDFGICVLLGAGTALVTMLTLVGAFLVVLKWGGFDFSAEFDVPDDYD